MAAPFDPERRDALIQAVSALDGVRHVGLDPRAGELWVACEPDRDRGPLEVAVRNALAAFGAGADTLDIRLSTGPTEAPRRRVRFLSVERSEERLQTRIAVELEWHDSIHRGSATCEKAPAIELNTTAAAVVDALERLTDVELGLRVVGVKRFRAFDSELMVASLSRDDGARQHLVGAVVVSADPFEAAALATLSALNRTLGNFLHTTD
jgi:hypothetical protein